MKGKLLAGTLSALIMLSLAACGDVDESRSSDHKKKNSALSSQTGNVSEISESRDESEPDLSSENNKESGSRAYAEVGYNGAKAVKEVYMSSEGEDLEGKVSFEDLYGRHALHTGVVGLVGAPVDVSFDTNEVKGGTLVFVVDRNELHGIRPDALMFMWYDENNDNYVEIEKTQIKEESEDIVTASTDIDSPGVYLLVNKYTWFNAWGAGLDDDGYEKDYVPDTSDLAPSSDWETYENTGFLV